MTDPVHPAEHYAYRVQWSPEEQMFEGSVLELPGFRVLTTDRAAAFEHIVMVTKTRVDEIRVSGGTPPTAY